MCPVAVGTRCEHAARLMVAGTGSGCGKTTVVCALLQALKNRGCDLAAFKCGPDYIDPMFHTEILGTPSANVDLFLSGEDRARMRFVHHSRDLNIIEGVMGCFDGLSMDSEVASSYDVARALESPIVLVVNVRGMALSVAALVKGFQELRRPSRIQGVIFNQAQPSSYPALKAVVERECGVRVYGFLPRCPECSLESRHLGLVTAPEVKDLREKMMELAKRAEQTLDIDGLISLMRAQPPLQVRDESIAPVGNVRIAVARDEVFCFYYRDNLELLEEMGAQIVQFSPLHDAKLPQCDGLWIGGGYPELYLESLSANKEMLAALREAVLNGLPTIAECGGFMLLCESIDDYPVAGVFPARCRDAKKLTRFGYVTLCADSDSMLLPEGEELRGHEFHRWDADVPGSALQAVKPNGRQWRCAWVSENLYAGYPHIYLYSNPNAARRFLNRCLERRMGHETLGN